MTVSMAIPRLAAERPKCRLAKVLRGFSAVLCHGRVLRRSRDVAALALPALAFFLGRAPDGLPGHLFVRSQFGRPCAVSFSRKSALDTGRLRSLS